MSAVIVTCPVDTFATAGQWVVVQFPITNTSDVETAYCETDRGSRGWPLSSFIDPVRLSPNTTFTIPYLIEVPDSAAAGIASISRFIGCNPTPPDPCSFLLRIDDFVRPLGASEENGAGVLSWQSTSGGQIAATLSRRELPMGVWTDLTDVESNGSGQLRYADRSIQPGRSYEYRLGFHVHDYLRQEGQIAFTASPLPWPELIGFAPNPARSSISVAFSLPAPGTATVEVFDVTGRRVYESATFWVAGYHSVNVGDGTRLRPGVYRIRLRGAGYHQVERLGVLLR